MNDANLNAPSQNLKNFEADFILRFSNLQISFFLFFCGIVIYYPVFFHQFQNLWDDQWVVINDYTEYGLNADNIGLILTEFYHGQYAPLNQIYYTSLYSLFGYNAAIFHTVSVLLHIINSILVFHFIKRILSFRTNENVDNNKLIAFITALLFVVHPVMVESVAWIAASKVPIYTIFYLLAILCYLKYRDGKKNKYLYLLCTTCFFILSFGGKEQAVTLPVCLLLLDYTTNRDLTSWLVWVEKIPFFILSIFFGFLTMRSQAVIDSGILSASQQYPFYQRIVFACYAIIEYSMKCILPVKLHFIYPFPNQIGQPIPLFFWIYPIALAAIIYSLWGTWKERWLWFAISFFIIHIAVTAHIIPISRSTITADRYVYVSAIGALFLISYYTVQSFSKTIKYRKLITALGITYIVSLAVYTNQHTHVWQDSFTLKQELREIIESRPDYHKHN
jgi:hypothetical protein